MDKTFLDSLQVGRRYMLHRNLDIKIKVKTSDLVTALEKNKAKHLEDYGKAVTVFFRDLTEILRKVVTRCDSRMLDADYRVNLTKPVNNEKLYDKYIGFFSMSTEDIIEISTEDYGCIVDDNWEWSVAASATNSYYSSKF